MEVGELPLPPTLLSKLLGAGYLTLDCSVSPIQLAQDADITPKEALDILKLVPEGKYFGSGPAGENVIQGAQTAWDILRDEKGRKKIVTSCKELDDILGGGISSKEVTEISGVPGIGKTQLGIQLAINVQIPRACGGVGGHAVYIDTEGSFMVERAIQMAESCIEEIQCRPLTNPPFDIDDVMQDLHVDSFLSHIHFFRVHSAAEQIAVVNRMERFLFDHKLVRLIVIDSVAFHFRQGFHSMGERTRLLCSMAQTLVRLADKHELAVVTINQVTQKITEQGSRMLPALGESWGHSTSSRVTLYWSDDGKRHAFLLKSPSLPRRDACFSISRSGIQSDEGYKHPSPDARDSDFIGGMPTDGWEKEPLPNTALVSTSAGDEPPPSRTTYSLFRSATDMDPMDAQATEIDPMDAQASLDAPVFESGMQTDDAGEKQPSPGASESVSRSTEQTDAADKDKPIPPSINEHSNGGDMPPLPGASGSILKGERTTGGGDEPPPAEQTEPQRLVSSPTPADEEMS